jgi:hypothetical protein
MQEADLKSLIQKLQSELPIAEFRALVMEARSRSELTLVNEVLAKPWREAHHSLYIADQIEAITAQCCTDDPPDIKFTTRSGIYNLEVTEILQPNRRRHQEYKNGPHLQTDEEVQTEIRETPNHVKTNIMTLSGQKCSKLTGKNSSILFFVNGTLSLFPKMIDFEALKEASAAVAAVCNDVWLVIGGKPYLIWRNNCAIPVSVVHDAPSDDFDLNDLFNED